MIFLNWLKTTLCLKQIHIHFLKVSWLSLFFSNFRTGAKYINISEEFRSKYAVTKHPKIQPMGADWAKKNKIACQRCGKAWGIEAEWNARMLIPLMKIDGFTIVDPAKESFLNVPRQWSSACFVPDVITIQNLLEEFVSSDSGNSVS